MKANIHPNWFPEAKVTCACGNTFVTGSTLPEIRVEICSNCHPFFTGSQKFVDTQGQVEKFQKKVATSQSKKIERQLIEEKRATKISKKKEEKPTLKDLLVQIRKQAAS